MTVTDPEIEAYASRHSTPESPFLARIAQLTHQKTSMPQMGIGHLQGAFLKMIVRLLKPQRVLEIGTFTGYSAQAMAEALSEEASLVTLDIDPENTAIAEKQWKKSPHGHKIKLLLGHALETLDSLPDGFDLAFIDADKENYIEYWDRVVPKVRQGGLIMADNVLWSGRVLAPKEDTDHAICRFNEHVIKDGRVEAVMLPIRDGLTLAYKF